MNFPQLYHQTKQLSLGVPLVRAAPVTGTGVTIGAGAVGEGVAILHVGAKVGAGTTLDVRLQHSDVLTATNSDWGNLTDKDGANVAFPQVTTGAQILAIAVPLNGIKKHVRAILDVSATGTSYSFSVALLAGGFPDKVSGGATF